MLHLWTVGQLHEHGESGIFYLTLKLHIGPTSPLFNFS